MAAVSLSDAWNDPSPEMFEQSPSAPAVSARPSRQATVAPPPEEEDEGGVVMGPSPAGALEASGGRLDSLLLDELRLMRAEESRRCTVYIVIAGVLFAMLFLYVDRLQGQIKVLNQALLIRTPHMQTPYAHRMSAEGPSKWY